MFKFKFFTATALILSYTFVADAQVMQTVKKLEFDALSDCQFGMMAMWEDGQVIASLGEDRKMCPASNLKAITTGAALCALGENFVWNTTLAYSGTISEKGVLNGDLYIIGGGDPLLGSNVKGSHPMEQEFSWWRKLLRDAGIVRIDGHVVGDGRALDGMRVDPSWQYGDLGTYYGTAISALNFYENKQDFIASPGGSVGAEVDITPTYPETPWMNWNFSECRTGEKGTGDKLYLYLTDGGNAGVMRGTLAIDRGKKTVMCSNAYPEYTLANEFCKYLSQAGVHVGKGPAGLPNMPSEVHDAVSGDKDFAGQPADDLTVIGRTPSMPLAFVVKHTNVKSDNLCAEMMFRSLGLKICGSSDIVPSRKAVVDVLRDSLHLDAQPFKIVIADGSGLSSHNFVSPHFMCQFLQKMLVSGHQDTFIGSMHEMMSGRVRAKTGSFKGCRTLCGYVLPASDDGKKIVFSIMVNSSHLSAWTLSRYEKQIVSQLCHLAQ